MEVRHMRAFRVVAEELSFSRASRILNVSQPALSLQIRQFEESLGVKLFERSTRKVGLTEQGRTFLPLVGKILEDLDGAVIRMRGSVLSKEVQFSMACGGGSFLAVSTGVVSLLKKHFPSIELSFQESNSAHVIERVKSREVDLGLVYDGYDLGSLSSCIVGHERWFFAMPEGNGNSGLSECISEIKTLVIPAQNDAVSGELHARVMSICACLAITPRHFIHASFSQGIYLVAEGMGCSVVPESFTRIKIPGVTYLPLAVKENEVRAVWRKSNTSRVLKVLLQTMVNQAQDMQADETGRILRRAS